MINILFWYQGECGLQMIEINQIILFCLVIIGKVFPKVLMAIHEKIKNMIIIVLGAVKMKILKQQL